MNVTRTQLDNGLRVLVGETHTAPVASFWIYYRVGSRNELPGRTGISHWVEHMLFKGTDTFSRGEFDKAVARAGGVFNGMTSHDWTTYFETFPSARIELALQVESDRMVNSIFDAGETELERSVILSEREGSENSYFWLLNEEVTAATFREHPYRHPIIGWRGDLHTLQRDNLFHHYRTFYTPRNAVAVAVGDFAGDAMLAQIDRYFGGLPAGPDVAQQVVTETPQQAERRIVLRGDDPTAYFIMAFQAPAATHPDFFPLTVLDAVLGGAKGMGLFGGGGNNRSNRLHRALVEQDLVVDIDSSFRPTIDPFLFGFYATLTPGVSHAQVEEAVWRELTRLQTEEVDAAELTKAIKQTKTQFAFSSESVANQAFWLGFSEVVASLEWLDNWLAQLSAVTAADVQRVARDYFAPARQTVGWYVPAAEIDVAELEDEA